MTVLSIANQPRRFLGTKAAAEYSGIPAGTLRAWRCQGIGPKFYKPRGRALYDVGDLDEFIRSGVRIFFPNVNGKEWGIVPDLPSKLGEG